MECSEPGAIRNGELVAYLEGDQVRPAVVTHLARCPHCSQQLVHYQGLERKLVSKLYRWDCPSNQALGEYHLGLLDEELGRQIQFHTQMCVHCAAELSVLAGFLAYNPALVERPVTNVQPQIAAASLNNHHTFRAEAKLIFEQVTEQIDQWGRVVASLLRPPLQTSQRDVAAQSTQQWPRRYTAKDMLISLQLEPDMHTRGPVQLQLLGLVTQTGVALETLHGTQVILSAAEPFVVPTPPDEQGAHAQQIDELGNFVFTHLTPATYTLELHFPQGTVVINQLALDFPH